MKAYSVTTDYSEYTEIAFADTASQAKSMAQRGDHLHDAEWTELRATRAPDFDDIGTHYGLAEWSDEPFVRRARSLGWHQVDGGCACVECGLYPFDYLKDTLLDEFDVCGLCRAEGGEDAV